MNAKQLKELAETLAGIAAGAEWECKWEQVGWAAPLGRDAEYCIANRVPIRLTREPITSDMLCGARLELLESIEEIGSATSSLREACNDLDDDKNLIGAVLCATDALEVVSGLEAKLSRIAAQLSKWIVFAEAEGSVKR